MSEAEQILGTVINILSGWQWRLYRSSMLPHPFPETITRWHSCTQGGPTSEIIPELRDAGYIPDPFLDLNKQDHRVQAVKTCQWLYACEFDLFLPLETMAHDLVFEGLDTLARVFINDTPILDSDNMFRRHRVPVATFLRPGTNVIQIRFDSAWEWGLIREANHVKKLETSNGHPSRVHVRKAAYHYGWDWAPSLMSCGIWREVRLESYSARIRNPSATFEVAEDLKSANLNVSWDGLVSWDRFEREPRAYIGVRVLSPWGTLITSEGTSVSLALGTGDPSKSKAGIVIPIPEPHLWWPYGHGEQHLYYVNLAVCYPRPVRDEQDGHVTLRVGARRASLIRRPVKDEEGESFFFEINNQPIYISGSNIVPLRYFPTEASQKDYHKMIDTCLKGNQNMLRVWGGGIYEHDEFYAECDRRGVLVWQDFMFSCAQYPWTEEFEATVTREARVQLYRLRQYCSIVVYAGNSEAYHVFENYDLEDFPARPLYEEVLPDLVANLAPGVAYLPGSPWSEDDSTNPLVGDIHQWHVWRGTQEPYQLWPKLTGRFVSEFGLMSHPSVECIHRTITDPAQRYPQSAEMEMHMKPDGGVRKLAQYILENIRVDFTNMLNRVYASQLVQAECIGHAIRSCRRRWIGPGREYCGGQLVWQVWSCAGVLLSQADFS